MQIQESAISEQAIREAWDADDLGLTATLAMRKHGKEIVSFLAWRLGSPSDGAEAFSMFAEDLWSGLKGFRWRCSLRTWIYVLARNAAQRYAAAPHRRLQRQRAFDGDSRLSAIVQELTTHAPIYQRTDVKTRVRALRERLSPEDQLLLVLRIDRGLAWRDLAMAISGDLEMDDLKLDREAARLRKCFERIKADLRRWAREDGIVKTTS
jgi:RNA polymerase sigma-70 factor (ECF subfamily)